MNEHDLPMKPTKPLRYAIGMFGTSIPINMFKTYALAFYVDTLGLPMTKYALIISIYTILDAIDNPVYGFLSDRTRTKWGRRRPWFVIGAPLLVLAFISFYNPPAGLAEGSLFWYMLLTYMLTGTLDSMINSNYGALFPELFRTEQQRAHTNALRQAFQLLAMVISIALTPVVTGLIGYKMTAIVYGALSISVIYFMTFGSHEDPTAMEKPKPALFRSILDIIAYPKFWLYGITNAAYFAGQGVLLAAVSLYVKYTLGLGGMSATIMQGTVIGVAIASIPIWVKIIKKMTLMPAWRLSLFVIAAGFIPLYFANTLLSATLILAIFGFGVAGVSTTMDIVGARVLDEDSAKHDVQREGTFSSLVGILNKTNNLFQGLAFVLASALYGYQSGDVPGPAPGEAARFLMVVFPFCAMLFCALFSFLLRFKEREAVAAASEAPLD